MATYPSGLTRAFPEPDDFPTAAAWGVQLEFALEEQPLGVLGRHVGDTRLVGAWPSSAVWRRSLL